MSQNRHLENCTWDGIPVMPYKEEGTNFKNISRQVLFEGNEQLPCQLRYFEIASGGHSTLERHDHIHVVMIVKGLGKALIDNSVVLLHYFDVIHIPQGTWHQFQACNNEPLGFLCLVHTKRDRPHRPQPDELELLLSDPEIALFIKV